MEQNLDVIQALNSDKSHDGKEKPDRLKKWLQEIPKQVPFDGLAQVRRNEQIGSTGNPDLKGRYTPSPGISLTKEFRLLSKVSENPWKL